MRRYALVGALLNVNIFLCGAVAGIAAVQRDLLAVVGWLAASLGWIAAKHMRARE